MAISLVALGLASAPAAAAGPTHPYIPSLSHSGYGDACGVAVDSEGDLYVADYGANVKVYDPSGTLITSTGAVAEPCGLAVDSAGNLYVNSWQGSVTKLVPSQYPPQGATTYSTDNSVNGNGVIAAGSNYGVAVDPATDNVYIAQGGHISSYEPDGTLLDSTIGEGVSGASYYGVAVSGTNGDVYATDGANSKAYVFSGSNLAGAPKTTIDGSNTPDGSIGFGGYGSRLGLDQSNGHLYVFDATHLVVDEFEASGAYVSQLSHSFSYGEPSDVAVDNSGGANQGNVYVAGLGAVSAFGPLTYGELPAVALEPVTGNDDGATATLNGTVNPKESPTTWQFLYGTTTSYGSVSPASPEDAGEGTSAVPVSAELSGLEPGTTYHYALQATSGIGTTTSEDATFTTPPEPEIAEAWASGVLYSEAKLNARINPNSYATTYRFEYGPTASYGTTIPVPDEAIGEGSSPVSVQQELFGLTPGSTYHYRVVAISVIGTSESADQVFHTYVPPAGEDNCSNASLRAEQHATYLPDCRAYEMVSPQDKNGGDVMSDTGAINPASSGNAIRFRSLVSFSDPQGTGFATDYMSKRTGAPDTTGWTTHPIAPLAESATLFNAIYSNDTYYVNLSPDDSCGLLQSALPLPGMAGIESLPNLYMRDDLLEPGAGDYGLVTDATVPVASNFPLPPPQPRYIGMTDDCSHVAFASSLKLVPEAGTAKMKTYEWVEGTLRLASVLPNGEPTASPASRTANGTITRANLFSTDGSRLVFQDDSNIYIREGGTTTTEVNASEKAIPDTPAVATIAMANKAVTRVFFTTFEALVDEDENESNDLYMYDATAPEGSRLTLISADKEEADGIYGNIEGIAGGSADGRQIYFYARGQLVAGEPLDGQIGLYLWDDGQLRFIGWGAANQEDVQNDLREPYGFTPLTSRVTPDGRYLLFLSTDSSGYIGRSGFTGYDHGICKSNNDHPCPELFLYDSTADHLVCASCNPSGAKAVSSEPRTTFRVGQGGTTTPPRVPMNLTDDGSRVFFSTPEGLLPEDTNGRFDAYEYDVASETLSLLSSGTDAKDSYFVDASPSGNDAFITTTQRLVGWDTDSGADMYDVRVDGGFPEPVPHAAPCEGEACRPGSTAAPSVVNPVSGSITGPPDPTPKRRVCPRGRHSQRTASGRRRCVPSRHRKGKHRKRRRRAESQIRRNR